MTSEQPHDAPSAGHRPGVIRGRGAQIQPANRFTAVRVEQDLEQVQGDDELLQELRRPVTQYLDDLSQSIVSENNSPDIYFRYSVNPYRGCAHGCSYCYARPTHEYLGLSAGLDFETKVFVKRRAPELFREWLARPAYAPEEVMFSGVTDCYQPVERELKLTRGCLEVAVECRQPIGIVTKNALVTRDLDLLGDLARDRAVRVAVSITTLDARLARVLEPRTSSPEARLRAVRRLSDAGIETQVLIAPVTPGLNDHEIPSILAAAREAGADFASYVLLRLPLAVREVFLDWLAEFEPDRRDRVEAFIRSTRGGGMNSSEFGQRMRGEGAYADHIRDVFATFARANGFCHRPKPLSAEAFRPPASRRGQMRLF